MEEHYEACATDYLKKDANTHTFTLVFDDQDILIHCSYLPENCADDCSEGMDGILDLEWGVAPEEHQEEVVSCADLEHKDLNGSWSGDWGKAALSSTDEAVLGVYEHQEGQLELQCMENGNLEGIWTQRPTRVSSDDSGRVSFQIVRNHQKDLSLKGSWGDGSKGALEQKWSLHKTSDEIDADLDISLQAYLSPAPSPPAFYPAPFESLKYQRSQGVLGYWVRDGDLIRFSLELKKGEARWEATFAKSDPTEAGPCIEDTRGCLVEVQASGELSEAEVMSLEKLVLSIPEKQCQREIRKACDPPYLVSIEVDGVSQNHYCCGVTADGFGESFYALIAELEEIVSTK